ncbi:uncharacterized protein LOC127285019 [Leptopilina boulardi]|uniref:uncharacterized protein LOC127285019 n=1 Tax=Leptopilina boulardi TaxID=63433 RepID=UPI0021F5CF87|nr:uncharacterized protein LOC127285019 [Leptopilina boulardi]
MRQLQIVLVSFIICQIRAELIDYATNSTTCEDKNMLPYALDENYTTWICDCMIKYLYFPKTDSCHAPYRQGPCLVGQYLILSDNDNFGKCEENPCFYDGLVPFKGGCHSLGQFGPPCDKDNQTALLVTLDFKLICSYPVFFGIITAPGKTCPIGSRRIALGICKKIL